MPSTRAEVDAHLAGFLQGKARAAAEQGMPGEVVEVLSDFLFAGGKRVRPLLCVMGWHAARGEGPARPVVRVAASLEMFHAFALVHDDIMDESETRRGKPTVHRAFTTRHTSGRSDAAAVRLGASAALLVGDLALAWSDELLHTAGLTPEQLAEVVPVIDTMRTEVMYGQYLDLLAAGRLDADVDRALAIARYKTAKYTVERPLHIGAALAGAGPVLLEALSAYALPLGESFQLRDDLLGALGDPATTGKPDDGDLREGKHTVLLSLALQQASPAQARTLRRLIGHGGLDAGGAREARTTLLATGAPAAVEEMITERHRQALAALNTAALPAAVTRVLGRLADDLTHRAW
ncbi:polyprenyl synthetase family protein [Streptomyces sp. NBC_00656]|uniref:polyprenyl synthetase family protein n=1 Tax=Streptomyces sp. NBC_00656 TaxID=2903668 RepID=UPI00324F2ACD